MPQDPMPRNPSSRINWTTSLFLIGTLVVAVITTPLYVLRNGFGWLEGVLLFTMFVVSGMSITVGYHRLFAHCSYRATWPVRLFTLVFGAAAFESSVLVWASEHRLHHKFTDFHGSPGDPHSSKRGMFWSHIGWLLVYSDPPLPKDNVEDLRRDRMLVWQDRYFVPLAIASGFLFPMLVASLVGVTLGMSLGTSLFAGFLFGGCLRVVLVQHATFLINSWCHRIGSRPYNSEDSSRDSSLMALFTFGEGYHNYHHTFQTDYRNGVRLWHFDPGKWAIWTMSRLGLASDLRRMPAETIRLRRVMERRRRLERTLERRKARLSEALAHRLGELESKLEAAHLRCRQLIGERSKLRLAGKRQRQRMGERFEEVCAELQQARREFRQLIQAWKAAARHALDVAEPTGAVS